MTSSLAQPISSFQFVNKLLACGHPSNKVAGPPQLPVSSDTEDKRSHCARRKVRLGLETTDTASGNVWTVLSVEQHGRHGRGPSRSLTDPLPPRRRVRRPASATQSFERHLRYTVPAHDVLSRILLLAGLVLLPGLVVLTPRSQRGANPVRCLACGTRDHAMIIDLDQNQGIVTRYPSTHHGSHRHRPGREPVVSAVFLRRGVCQDPHA